MAGDWTVYWLTSIFGLVAIGVVIGISCAIWRGVLGADFAKIGFRPLAFAYLCAGIGYVGSNFVSCYLDFSNRVAEGLLSEHQRWSIVPGWTMYATILLLVIALPLLGLVGVPVMAIVLKRALLTPKNIALCVLAIWLALSALGFILPGNEWHRTHPLESFAMSLKELLPAVLFIALPFMVAVYWGARSYRTSSQRTS
jgi:hypothetical protein